MQNVSVSFILIHVSTLLVALLFIYIFRKPNKGQLHYVFLGNLGLLVIWGLSVILESYMQLINPDLMIYFEYLTYIGIAFFPVTLLLTGLVFAHTRIDFNLKYILLFVIPIITTVIIWTNNYHHLFYKDFSFTDSSYVPGSYFMIHTIYSYLCIAVGLYYLVYFSIKNSGIFSRQALLVIVGTLVPLVVNALYTLKIINVTIYGTPIAFAFLVGCYIFATMKYNFLSIAPIALQKVVDLISDSFVVLNEDLTVIDYNKTFVDTFGNIFKIKRSTNFLDIFAQDPNIGIDASKLGKIIRRASQRKRAIIFESHIKSGALDKYFTVEVTPIIASNNFIGTIILLKDITQSKRDLQTIREKQNYIMQERLVSMGQLIGGIAHNMKTPIMSISGGIEALKDLVKEYEDSIGDPGITDEDHHDIAREMTEWLTKMKPYCSYMSDIISSVKGQAVQLNASTTVSFTLYELITRLESLMKQELKKHNCFLNKDFSVDMSTELKGDVNNLVQIFDNLIMNAIYAYEEKSGRIDFEIKKQGNNIEFTIRDYGKGIRADIKDKLFKQMVTTKGKDGTGLGLYISYSNIKARFNGNMWFESQEGKGTSFYISIPCTQQDHLNREANQ